ncbi:MAG: sulfite exporter TauE/SafE family protein [Devosia sp.]
MLPELVPTLWVAILLITLLAGFVKGAVGFAMPMIMVSGLGTVLAPELALAALIIPTLATNVVQAFRQGVGAAWGSVKAHWRFLLTVMVVIGFAAQLVRVVSDSALFLILGIPVVVFALIQLVGVKFTITKAHRLKAELVLGSMAGFIGGLSGVWGPPTVMYLTALNTPKAEQVRVLGVVFGLSAIVLALAHINSGVLNQATAPFSALLLVPALAGVFVGILVQDRLDQDRFRKATLIVLIIAGLNLVRRGLMG